jgi:hypothetical protein
MSNIVLNSKTYAGIGFNQNGQSVFKETSAGVPSGFSYLTEKTSTGTGKSDSTVKWNLSLPVVATVDSDCSCAGEVLRTAYVRLEISFAASSTAAERTDVLDRLQDLVLTSQFIGSLTNLDQPT